MHPAKTWEYFRSEDNEQAKQQRRCSAQAGLHQIKEGIFVKENNTYLVYKPYLVFLFIYSNNCFFRECP